MSTASATASSEFLIQGLLRNRTLTVKEFDLGFSVTDRGKEEAVEYSNVEAFQFGYSWNALRGSDYSITIWTEQSAAFKRPRPETPRYGFQFWRPRDPANRRKSFRLARGPEIVEPPDETLMSIRDRLTENIANRLMRELQSHGEIPWVPKLHIVQDGLEFRDRLSALCISFGEITNMTRSADGTMGISTSAGQVLQINCSDINFYPGLAVVENIVG